jgi:hypothetical protein
MPVGHRHGLAWPGAVTLMLLGFTTRAQEQADASGDTDTRPTAGTIQFLPGPLGPVQSADDAQADASPHSLPVGWHLPGAHYKSGNGWFALVCERECRLYPANLAVTPARHGIYDGDPIPSQLLRWSPLPFGLGAQAGTGDESAGQARVIAMLSAPDSAPKWLAARSVTTWLHAGMARYPGSGRRGTLEVAINHGAAEPALLLPRARRNDVPPGQDASISFELELRIGATRQRLGAIENDVVGDVPIAPRMYLKWAGDLDGDGKPDLLVSLGASGHHDLLYLSSLAKAGELVGLAGTFSYTDPSFAGC